MHIAFLTPEYPRPDRPEGGLANYLRKVGAALAERGHEVTVLVRSERDRAWDDGEVSVREVATPWAARLAQLARASPTTDLVRNLEAAVRLRRALVRLHRVHPVDVVQASSYLAPGVFAPRDLPLVCRVSSLTPSLRAVEGRTPSPAELVGDRLEARQIRRADASFAPSRLVADRCAEELGVRPRVVPSPVTGVPEDTDPSVRDRELTGRDYLLFLGTLNRVKGIDLLAGALLNVFADHPRLHVVLVGRDDGIDGRSAVAHVRAEIGEEYRVHHLGVLPRAAVVPVLASALGLVVPSRIDNHPNVVLEALAVGTPVVGTRGSSIDELIVEGRGGFLADNGDPASLRGAIERLLEAVADDPQGLRAAAREHAAELSRRDPVGRLEALYEETVGRHGGRR